MATEAFRLPSYYIPHGAGPCFFMDWDPADEWAPTAEWLTAIGGQEGIRAILVVSAHWEAPRFTFTTAARPSLLFDYYGFPDSTYRLRYGAAGAPELARQAIDLLSAAGLPAGSDETRGLDHGVFVPLMVARPQADRPVVEMSLKMGLDPAQHLAAGRALAPLRDQGVLIVGSGMSFHNMRGFGNPTFADVSRTFDDWLVDTVAASADERARRLTQWTGAPAARLAHPREEHLLPLMVATGAAGDEAGRRDFTDQVMGVTVSGMRFG